MSLMYSQYEWTMSSGAQVGIIVPAAPAYFNTSEIFVRDSTYFMNSASLHSVATDVAASEAGS